MAYNLTYLSSEKDYRSLFESLYCDHGNPVFTHDGIRVKFFPDKFDHAFFESASRSQADKSIFSAVRAEKITWILDVLRDPTADLRVGWDSTNKRYDNSRRVAIVKGDYVVIIHIKDATNAKFITAYQADNSIGKILHSPPWP